MKYLYIFFILAVSFAALIYTKNAASAKLKAGIVNAVSNKNIKSMDVNSLHKKGLQLNNMQVKTTVRMSIVF